MAKAGLTRLAIIEDVMIDVQKIAVVMGGKSVESDISLKSGRMVSAALRQKGYSVLDVVIDQAGQWTMPDLKLEKLSVAQAVSQIMEGQVSVAVIMIHGPYGEDGTIQGFFEILDLPYTGSDVIASALCIDKIKYKALLKGQGILTPGFLSFSKRDWHFDSNKIIARIQKELRFPCVVKSPKLGSSVGIWIVKDLKDMEGRLNEVYAFGEDALIEEYISGIEVTCGVLDDPETFVPVALPPTEIVPSQGFAFFDYTAKYTKGATAEITPARISTSLTQQVQSLALRIHQFLGCSGVTRTDIILQGDDLYVLETNTIPGMTETSLIPQAASLIGVDYVSVVERLIQVARKRYQAKKQFQTSTPAGI